jgi:hypothetical protein
LRALTRFWKRDFVESVCNGRQDYLRLLSKAHAVHHFGNDLNANLAVLFDLVFKGNNQSPDELFSVEVGNKSVVLLILRDFVELC